MNLLKSLEILRSSTLFYSFPILFTLLLGYILWKFSHKSVRNLTKDKNGQNFVSTEGIDKWPIGEDLKSGGILSIKGIIS